MKFANLLVMRARFLFTFVVTFFVSLSWCQAQTCLEVFSQGNRAAASEVGLTVEPPHIESSRLQGLVRRQSGRDFFDALWKEQRVFVKPSRLNSTLFAEKNWLVLLNRLQLGPKLLGVTQIGAREALVLQAVEGDNTQFPMAADDSIHLTPPMVAEMWRQVRVLFENHIWPVDLQFLVSKSGGVVMIDPELFESSQSNPRPWRDYENVVNHILVLWQLDDRLSL